MFKKLALFFAAASILSANSLLVGMSLDKLKSFDYEDQFEKKIEIPDNTRLIILSYEKGTGATVNELLNEQSPSYLSDHNALFIADISGMPSLITSWFALPKMQKYKHTIYLNYAEPFAAEFPPKEEQITLLRFDTQNLLSDITYVSTKEELQKAIEQ
jgi:hypothetical protein